ncbi:hypothetical protein HMPREF9444_01213 [Succinatimonas hippei YIT 12066]|uniref:Lipoprotein n=1 Tax=Succinatimonas hippei (strain DSM 22608 / JCM 16073 / KCTC 15190 / YIT 12066) TaxID=762983 RepID=E8LKH3_SUCHY|nr:hypothetical protein HMPREF9444_01213 [Succinatimonas hippei YIT 12066]
MISFIRINDVLKIKIIIAALILLTSCTHLKSTAFSVKNESDVNVFAASDYAEAFDDFAKVLKHKLSFGKDNFSIVGFDDNLNRKFSAALLQKGASVCSGSEFCSGISLRLELVTFKENIFLVSVKAPDFTLNRAYAKKQGSLQPISAFTIEEK